MALLQDMGQKCKTVKQLTVYLKAIGNSDALDVLGYHGKLLQTSDPVRTSVDLCWRNK